MKKPNITCLFLDIGGVLLTDGWDTRVRRRAAKKFKLNWDDMETRHKMNFFVYEEGKMTLNEYLNRVIFYKKRPFSRADFRRFMFEQSRPFPDMIELMAKIKARYGLKIFVVSNEGRETNGYRIQKFKLSPFVDAFISSCYVGARKPDFSIFKLALDLAQVPIERIIYIDNTAMFTDLAQKHLGIRSLLHTGYKSTRAQLGSLGLRVD